MGANKSFLSIFGYVCTFVSLIHGQTTNIEFIEQSPLLGTFNFLLNALDLKSTINDGNFTIFAPTNDAFFNLPIDMRLRIPDDNEFTLSLLQHHITEQILNENDLILLANNGENIQTLNGDALGVQLTGSVIIIIDGRGMKIGLCYFVLIIHILSDIYIIL